MLKLQCEGNRQQQQQQQSPPCFLNGPAAGAAAATATTVTAALLSGAHIGGKTTGKLWFSELTLQAELTQELKAGV